MINTIKNHFNFTSERFANTNKTTIAASLINGIASAEMALYAIANVFLLMRNPANLLVREALSINLGGSIFYGLCASNQIPGSSIIGAIFFSIYSCITLEDSDTYLSAKALGKSINFIADILEPIVAKIVYAVDFIFTNLPIVLPHEPIWEGVAILVVAIGVYKCTQWLLSKPEKAV